MSAARTSSTLERRHMTRSATAGRNDARTSPFWHGSRMALALQLLGAVLVVSAVLVGAFSSHAGAAALSNGTVALRVASNGSVATSPLSDGQVVDVAVAPNSTLSQSS